MKCDQSVEEPSLLRAGLRLPNSSLADKFPEGLARRAERVWRAGVHPLARTSKLQDDVSAVLWSLGVAHKSNEVTADGLFCVDIALEGGKVYICLPVQCQNLKYVSW